jgi:hypothetical protein
MAMSRSSTTPGPGLCRASVKYFMCFLVCFIILLSMYFAQSSKRSVDSTKSGSSLSGRNHNYIHAISMKTHRKNFLLHIAEIQIKQVLSYRGMYKITDDEMQKMDVKQNQFELELCRYGSSEDVESMMNYFHKTNHNFPVGKDRMYDLVVACHFRCDLKKCLELGCIEDSKHHATYAKNLCDWHLCMYENKGIEMCAKYV